MSSPQHIYACTCRSLCRGMLLLLLRYIAQKLVSAVLTRWKRGGLSQSESQVKLSSALKLTSQAQLACLRAAITQSAQDAHRGAFAWGFLLVVLVPCILPSTKFADRSGCKLIPSRSAQSWFHWLGALDVLFLTIHLTHYPLLECCCGTAAACAYVASAPQHKAKQCGT